MATVVSAYFPIPSKFPPGQYLTWIKDFMENIPCHLVFFAPQEIIGLISQWRVAYMDRTIFIPFDFTQCEAFKKYGYEFWEKELEKDLERKIHSPELYATWYEKKEFVLKAIEQNPFKHDKYLWADAGGFRVKEWFPELKTFASAHNISDTRFFLLSISPFLEEEKANYLKIIDGARIGGGYLAAHKNVWTKYSEKYDEMMKEYMGENLFMGKDQNIMASMYLKDPDFFQLVDTDHTSRDAWFWPQIYFSRPAEITILIPLYNGIEFLHTSLTSIIQQTYKEWNVIIGINGHPPGAPVAAQVSSIISQLGCENRVKVIQLDTKGKPASMNAMVKYVNTEWVAVLDVDDIWTPNKLAEQMPFLENFDVIGAGCQYFENMEGIIPSIPYGNISGYNFFSGNPIINSSVILKTKYLCYNESELLEDYELWLRLCYKESCKFYNVPQILVGHRIHRQSAFNYTNRNNIDEFIEKYKKLYLY